MQDKKIVAIVVPLQIITNIAYVYVDENMRGSPGWLTWVPLLALPHPQLMCVVSPEGLAAFDGYRMLLRNPLPDCVVNQAPQGCCGHRWERLLLQSYPDYYYLYTCYGVFTTITALAVE